MEWIDTHLHLILPDRFGYAWTAGVPALAGRAWSLEDYHRAAAGTGLTGALFMEVDVDDADRPGEAAYFCQLAEDPRHGLLGVIASCRPEEDDWEATLDAIAHPKLKGLRRVLHTQPDDLSRNGRFRANVASLAARDLAYDLCVLPRQLPAAIGLADACPDTRFVLDHAGIPDIAGGDLAAWKRDIAELARREHVACKLSGLVAYCRPGGVSLDALRPVFEHAAACFGWDRLLWGGDWPVCNTTASLARWTELSRELVAGEPAAHQDALFAGSARRIYKLDAAPA